MNLWLFWFQASQPDGEAIVLNAHIIVYDMDRSDQIREGVEREMFWSFEKSAKFIQMSTQFYQNKALNNPRPVSIKCIALFQTRHRSTQKTDFSLNNLP